MKILFFGDYSNLHTTLARELRKLGHQVHVLSDGCGHMKLPSDIYLKREKGWKGSFKYLYDIFSLLPSLKDYDVVQLINTNFLSLKPQKIKYFYDRLREQNRSMFLTFAGNDYPYVKACHDAKIFRFSEFKIGTELTDATKQNPEHMYGWLHRNNRIWTEYLLDSIDGAMAVLPEYYMATKPLLGEKVSFTNLPVDFSQLPQALNFENGNVRIAVAMRAGVEIWKGTKILHEIALEIEKEMPDMVETEVLQNLSFSDFLLHLSKADIVLDQLYAYSPAMTALYGMGLGKVVGTGAQPEYYDYIGETSLKPLFALSPLESREEIKNRLKELVSNRERILEMGKQSNHIALTHNDASIVAKRFLNQWEDTITRKVQ